MTIMINGKNYKCKEELCGFNGENLKSKDLTKISELSTSSYSELRIYPNGIDVVEFEEIKKSYFLGTKQIIFMNDKNYINKLIKVIELELDSRKISLSGNNLVFNSNNTNKINIHNGNVNFFNFQIFYAKHLDTIVNHDIYITNGNISEDERSILNNISKLTSFNLQQYLIEHADINQNIVVKAGAGTGKTYSMISRITYLCHQDSGANILDTKSEIAMLTFTTDAASNMKRRLKQAFENYFILTDDKKYLEKISQIENMCISTIHSFTNSIIKNTSLPLGIGVDFSTVSGDYQKQRIFDSYFNEYLSRKNKEEPLFFGAIPGSIYNFRKMLLGFSDKLYNIGVDIKQESNNLLGKPISEFPYINEIIEDVIVKTEEEYSRYLFENNSINLKEYMSYLNKCVKDESFNTNLYKYKYIFIDEFQDTDDLQISSFIEMQKKLKFKFFIVGDLKQSIYRFRGATMNAFDKIGCMDSNWLTYNLTINYRSDKRLLQRYDILFNHLGNRELIPYSGCEDSLVGVNYNSCISDDEVIESYQYNDDDILYDQLFDLIDKRKSELEKVSTIKKLSLAERTIAILVRTNYEVDEILRKSRSYSDITIESDTNGNLYRVQSTIDLCKLTSALSNPRNSTYLFDLLISNNINIDFPILNLLEMDDQEKLSFLISCLDKFYMNLLGITWSQLVYEVQSQPILMVLRKIYNASRPWKIYSSNHQKQIQYRENYDLLFQELASKNKNDYLTLDSINESLHILIKTGAAKSSQFIDTDNQNVRVICTTVHKSKGLEYDTVILPKTDYKINSMHRNGLDVTITDQKLGYCISVDGDKISNQYFNIENELSEIEMEESRILYVALTRAINKFCWFNKTNSKSITWAKLLEVI